MLYQTYQAQRDLTAPAVALAKFNALLLERLPAWAADNRIVRLAAATNQLVARARLTHTRPPFGIDSVLVAGQPVAVREEVTAETPFASLVHFAKETSVPGPKVLVVAALAGHFSTLLRSTVATMLVGHDVYLTDWHNARDVPLGEGTFGFDDYVAHLIGFLQRLGPETHALGVCQPCPATLAATAIMAEDNDPATPRTLTLMAGPVDCRVSPTAVNDLAVQTPLSWFEHNVITTVPARYAGAGRHVYPGFLQLGAFVGMNPDRHVDAHLALFHDLVVGDRAAAATTISFYDEYGAVLDLCAEFYLETLDRVFQRFLLPRGLLTFRGRPVNTAAIRRTALLTVEGGRDDICGIGQTMAAHDLCKNVPASARRHHLQANAGHYGVFSGRTWERQVSPIVANFVLSHA
jgi:poly(3-hydroxybutyrate) depolymerase